MPWRMEFLARAGVLKASLALPLSVTICTRSLTTYRMVLALHHSSQAPLLMYM